MFRIIFDPDGGVFRIQILAFYLFWVTLKHWNSDPTGPDMLTKAAFRTLDETYAYIAKIGLNKLYHEKTPYQAWMFGPTIEPEVVTSKQPKTLGYGQVALFTHSMKETK